MEITESTVLLHTTESIVTDVPEDAYRIVSGAADVFIAPWTDGKTGRRIYLSAAAPGTVVPSFSYRDRDFQRWKFVIVARQDTELQRLPGSVTSVLKKRFAQKIDLPHFEDEGFENSLVEFYKREIVKDDVFIERGKQQAPKAKSASYSAIKGAFDKGHEFINSDDPAYKAVAYACQTLGFGVTPFDELENICRGQMTVPNMAHASKLICRDILLEPGWYKEDCGLIIGNIEDAPVVCVPHGRRYRIYFPSDGRTETLTKATANTVDPKAYVLSRPLPSGSIKKKNLIAFGRKELSRTDLTGIILLGLIGALIGILLPTLNQKIYDDYIPIGDYSELIQFCIVIGSFMIGNLFFSIVKSLCEFRLKSRVGYHIQDAAYYRLFRLPESFFHSYDSADLAQRLMAIGPTINSYVSSVLITGISTFFSLLYLVRMFKYSGKLTWFSLLMIAVYVALLIPLVLNEVKYEKEGTESRGDSSAKLYQYLNGIQKIRMAGVEDRAIYDYMIPFSRVQAMEIRKNRLSTSVTVLAGISSTIFSMILYYVMVKSKLNVSMGSFIGFNTALGSFTAAIQNLVDNLLGVYKMKPTYDRFKPLFETPCEDDETSELPGEITGDISIRHVSFSYSGMQKMVLDDFSLDIHPGEYVGIVGSSGCGKSTLLKLLLGFETPGSGQICYDGKDLRGLDKQAFRRNLGVVLQNGRLIAGSIFENITITAPEATLSDVEKVLDAVGLRDDIKQMPMGVHTVLSENSGTISGGQQQRILIARAIIRQPSILIFDEATSALDNLTQATVTESLDKMHVTRIVVAHRLSTIRTCDRIIVMDGGRIAEEGNYDSLMAQRGLFYQLASRQIAE